MEDKVAEKINPVTQAPIKVTEEMRRAGVAAFVESDLRFDALVDVLAEVYRAMASARSEGARE